jgi:acetoin utilization deacetylase AcuC-like enzyme
VSELLMIEQRQGSDDAAPWVLEGGRRIEGHDSNRRLAELRDGLMRHAGVRPVAADAPAAEVERTLGSLHESNYLEALRGVAAREHVILSDFATPGLEPDIPVCAELVAAAHEGVRTAITAATRLADGARFTYAVCRPPGHHAGPAWFGGYCYLNNAGAAVRTLCESGMKPVGVLDLDLHYPNGTSAVVEQMPDASLHSLHASPVTNVPADTVLPQMGRERVVEFAGAPDPAAYLDAVAASIDELMQSAAALVVSLGYDTVAGDPHGSWSFEPAIFTAIGGMLAASGLPICVIQEGGYSLETLAGCSHAFAIGLLDGSGG